MPDIYIDYYDSFILAFNGKTITECEALRKSLVHKTPPVEMSRAFTNALIRREKEIVIETTEAKLASLNMDDYVIHETNRGDITLIPRVRPKLSKVVG